MSVRTSDYPAKRRIDGRKAGSVFIAIIVWASGVAFTRGALPLPPAMDTLGVAAPWVIAIVIQLALSLAQSNVRARGFTLDAWPYWLLVAADIAANAIGLLTVYKVIPDPGAILAYMVVVFTTGQGLWQLVGAGIVGAVVAVLPESLIKDAKGGT